MEWVNLWDYISESKLKDYVKPIKNNKSNFKSKEEIRETIRKNDISISSDDSSDDEPRFLWKKIEFKRAIISRS